MSGGGGAPSSRGKTPRRKTHRQLSVPLEKDQVPLRTYPPSTGSTMPVGAYDDEMSTRSSSPHTSSCACRGNNASCQLCAATTASTQAVEAHTVPISITASKKSIGSDSRPLNLFGCNARNRSASCRHL